MNTQVQETEVPQDGYEGEDVTTEPETAGEGEGEASTGADSREATTFSPAIIPNAEDLAQLCADIKAASTFKVDVKPVTFRFKTTKNDAGVEVKRDAMEVPVAFPNVQGLADIIQNGGKELELLMDAVESVITQQARSLITEDWNLNAVNMPNDKLSWNFIANMPKPERMGTGIAKEIWEDFGKDYIVTMPEATGKSIEKVSLASKLLVGKLAAIKTNFPALEMLTEQLTIYISASKRAEEFAPCVEFLIDKAEKLLNVTPEQLLENL